MGLLDERIDPGLGVLVFDPAQQHVAAMPLIQGRDLAAVATEQQITLTVTRYRTILSLGQALPDRPGFGNPAMIGGLLRVMA